MVNVGRRQDSALYVQRNFSVDLYDYYMPALEHAAREYAGLVGSAGVQNNNLEKWKKANLAEIRSFVCDNDV